MDQVPPASQGRRWFDGARRGVSIAGATALATHVILLWTGQFHSQDGPAHMFAVATLRRLLGGDTGTLSTIYTANIAPDPNWITYPLLAMWVRGNPPRVAELVLVTLLVVGVAGAVHYALTARGHATGPVAIAGFAVAVGWSLHTGLYNFTASVGLALVVIGYHVRVAGRLNVWRALVLAVLLVLLYFSHPLSLIAAFLTLGATGLSVAIADIRARRSWRVSVARLAAMLAAAAPSAVLLLLFLADPGSVRPRDTPRGLWDAVLGTMLFRWPIQAVTPADAGWATALAWSTWGVVVVLLVRRIMRRDWSRWDLLLVPPLVTGACALALPDRLAGGTLVQPRLAIYALLTLLMWIAVANADVRLAQWLGVGLGVVGVVVLFGLAAVRGGPYREIHAAIEEVRSVVHDVVPGSTMLAAVSSRAPEMSPVVPLVHVADLVALDAGAVPVSTLDAGSGYGPIRYVRRFDPEPALRGYPRNRAQAVDQTPQEFKNVLRRYAGVTGVPFDYILLVAYDITPLEIQEFEDLGFRLVARTEPSGIAHLIEVTPRAMPPPDALTAVGPAGGARRRGDVAAKLRRSMVPERDDDRRGS